MTKIDIIEIPVEYATAQSLVQKELLRPRCVDLNLHKRMKRTPSQYCLNIPVLG
jgi:hypothetical protein